MHHNIIMQIIYINLFMDVHRHILVSKLPQVFIVNMCRKTLSLHMYVTQKRVKVALHIVHGNREAPIFNSQSILLYQQSLSVAS